MATRFRRTHARVPCPQRARDAKIEVSKIRRQSDENRTLRDAASSQQRRVLALRERQPAWLAAC